jgi:hypothetical protein
VKARALVASLIGTSIEYYDYLPYETVDAVETNKLFFPNFHRLGF